MSHQAQLVCYLHSKSQFHTSTHSSDKGLSEILQPYCLGASKAITEDLVFW